MAKVSSLIEEVLYEKNKNKIVSLYYNINVFIQDFKEKEKEVQQEPVQQEPVQQEPVQQEPVQQEPVQQNQISTEPTSQPQESTVEDSKILNEDIFKSKKSGVIELKESESENIQTLNDLLDFVSDKKEDGKNLINDLVIEIILNVVDPKQDVSSVINKGDKVLIDLDYGFDKDDSIGIKVTKMSGSGTMSVSMKKDNKILSGNFNLSAFNNQLIFYRNAIMV